MGRKINGLITFLVSIFIVIFPIIVFRVIPPNEPQRLVILGGITLSVVISGFLHLNIGLFYSSILLSYKQQKQLIKQHPVILNILYGLMIINFVILLKYVIFMSFTIEPTVFWKVVLFTIFMII